MFGAPDSTSLVYVFVMYQANCFTVLAYVPARLKYRQHLPIS
jgi:hypothetical protein